jgi:hypothetical protein
LHGAVIGGGLELAASAHIRVIIRWRRRRHARTAPHRYKPDDRHDVDRSNL